MDNVDTKTSVPVSNSQMIHEYRLNTDPKYRELYSLQQADKPLTDMSLVVLPGLARVGGMTERLINPYNMNTIQGLAKTVRDYNPSTQIERFGLVPAMHDLASKVTYKSVKNADRYNRYTKE